MEEGEEQGREFLPNMYKSGQGHRKWLFPPGGFGTHE